MPSLFTIEGMKAYFKSIVKYHRLCEAALMRERHGIGTHSHLMLLASTLDLSILLCRKVEYPPVVALN